MSKWEMIQAIRQVNRTVSPDFLSSFQEQELASYLRRLQMIQVRPRCQSAWLRERNTHGAVPCED